MNWWYLLIFVGAFVVSLFFEAARELYEEGLEYLIEAFNYIISLEWLSDLGEIFSNGWEAITNIGESPLVNVWFWAFYICLLAGVWYLPSAMGMIDYTFIEKIEYTVIFFIVDWFIIAHFQNS